MKSKLKSKIKRKGNKRLISFNKPNGKEVVLKNLVFNRIIRKTD